MEDDDFNDNDSFGGDDGGDNDSFNGDPDMEDDDDHIMKPKKEFVAMNQTDLMKAVEALVADLADELNTSKLMAAMLLRGNNWNKERIQSRFFEDSDALLTSTGLQFLEKPVTGGGGDVECQICDEEVAFATTHALGCGHRFCLGCWTDALEAAVAKGKQGVITRCPGYKCPAVVDDDTIKARVSEASSKRFQTSVLRSFVEDSAKIRWCPAPGCENAIKGDVGVTSVVCNCGFKFCFQCGEEEHAPVSCKNLTLWLDKCRNESETAHWIIANTKKCPKCMVRIEKNQGCNHMACPTCSHEFCWICMGDWVEHGNHTGGYYKCNKYDPKKEKPGEKKPGDKQDEAKADLDRYLHYYQRYHNHDQSKRFAQRQRVKTEERMTNLQQRGEGDTWMDVQFLKAATDQVFECRQVLKYTYAFGYYLTQGPEKELFEYLQQELEKNTEHLSELSERQLDKLDRQQVVNYTRVTKKFLQNLLDGVANGLTGALPDEH